jgi:hypothetical protein
MMRFYLVIALLVAGSILAMAAEVNLVVVDKNDKPLKNIEVAFRPLTGGMYGELMKPGKTDKNGMIELKIGPISEEVDFMLYFEGDTQKVEEGLAAHAKGGNSIIKVEKTSTGYRLYSSAH